MENVNMIDVLNLLRRKAAGGVVNLAVVEIAEELGTSPARLQRMLKTLQAEGLIEIKPPPAPGEPSTFTLLDFTDQDHLFLSSRRLSRIADNMGLVTGYLREVAKEIGQIKADAIRCRQLITGIISVEAISGNICRLLVNTKEAPWLADFTNTSS